MCIFERAAGFGQPAADGGRRAAGGGRPLAAGSDLANGYLCSELLVGTP